jgi:hypothetical protein
VVIARLVRLAQLALAAAGLVWIVRAVRRFARESAQLLRMLEGASAALAPLEGVDPVTGDRYGVRLTPLGPAELRAVRNLEESVRANPDIFADAG